MKKTLLMILATLFIIIGGIIVFIKMSNNGTNTTNESNDKSTKSDTSASSEILDGSVSISIRNLAYSREKITIKKAQLLRGLMKIQWLTLLRQRRAQTVLIVELWKRIRLSVKHSTVSEHLIIFVASTPQ